MFFFPLYTLVQVTNILSAFLHINCLAKFTYTVYHPSFYLWFWASLLALNILLVRSRDFQFGLGRVIQQGFPPIDLFLFKPCLN